MSPRPTLLEALTQRTLLCDGAMGTQLQLAGLEPGTCGELWNVENPNAVLAIHRKYAEAGADCLITNTFGGSRILLEKHGLGERTAEINKAGAALVRKALGERGYVLGDIGPFGGMLAPFGEMTAEELEPVLREQAVALLEGGADALLCETQTALDEAEVACRAARSAGASIVIVSFAFDKGPAGFRTMMGLDPATAAAAATEWGADIVGANCGAGLLIDDYAALTTEMAGVTTRPLMIQPNAGAPERVGDAIVYHESPEKMAHGLDAIVAAGARIIGGCCGTTPEHICIFGKALHA